MTEHWSLYARVSLSANALAAYRRSPIARATDFEDWLPWLPTQPYYGPRMTQADIATIASSVSLETAGDWIDDVERSSFGARSAYDPAAECWTLMAPFFSEAFREFIQAFAVLRAAARFKDRPGNDFILIFPLFWDSGGVGAGIAQGSSTLWDPLPQDALAEASSALRAYGEEMNRGQDPDQL
jgi:hypothetical protein